MSGSDDVLLMYGVVECCCLVYVMVNKEICCAVWMCVIILVLWRCRAGEDRCVSVRGVCECDWVMGRGFCV